MLHNVSHGVMSNVETSLYLWDLSQCLSRATKDMLINWTVSAILNESKDATVGSSVFKDHPVILMSTRDLKRECADLISEKKAPVEKLAFESHGREVSVIKHGNLYVLDFRPSLIRAASKDDGRVTPYQLLKSHLKSSKNVS